MAHIAVIGGGITALACADALVAAGHQVSILEATDRVGGKLRGASVAGRSIDVGAESMLWRHPRTRELFARLGLTPQHPSGASAALWSRGQLHPIPTRTVMGVPSDPDLAAGVLQDDELRRLRAAVASPIAADAALGEVVDASLGPAVTDRLVEPLLGGVYAGQARLLSMRACLPALAGVLDTGADLITAARAALPAASADPARAPEPVFATATGGTHALVAQLRVALEAAGVQIEISSPVQRLERRGHGWRLSVGGARPANLDADAVVIATPAPAAADLLAEVEPAAAQQLSAIEYASMALATYAFEASDAAMFTDRTGLLVPPIEGRVIKAATFSSSKWPWLAQRDADLVFVRASIGRYGDTVQLQRTDEELLAAGLSDLAEALGTRLPAPVETHLQRWDGGLPQYAPGHLDRVEHLLAAVATQPGLAVAGAALHGVGIPACVADGQRAAAQVVAAVRA
ncbi:protoporphyrinogen oxidase [Dermacoccaceae bacterium W4C1]